MSDLFKKGNDSLIISIPHQKKTALHNFWNAVHFHPTDAIEDEWGKKIIDGFAENRIAHTVRMYAMFEDIVSKDSDGNLVFDFSLNDTRMDYMVQKGFRLLISYNFIPPCIAADPKARSVVSKNSTRYKGKTICTSAPEKYEDWEEICYRYTAHILKRYGKETVKTWYLQCYNEPDIKSFFLPDVDDSPEGTVKRVEEYVKLYAAFVHGICRADADLVYGGPALANKMLFLHEFLAYTKEHSLPVKFLSLHSYGTQKAFILQDSLPMNPMNHIVKHENYLAVIRQHLDAVPPIIYDEWGMSAQGFGDREEVEEFLSREKTDFAAYFARLITLFIENDTPPEQMLICLSGQHEMTEEFTGFRGLLTLHGIRKPIYNAYLLAARLGDTLEFAKTYPNGLSVVSTVKGKKRILMLGYCQPTFAKAPDLDLTMTFEQSSDGIANVTRIDPSHRAPFEEAERLGLPRHPDDADVARLKAMAEDLTPEQIPIANGQISLTLQNSSFVLIEEQ